ncbi:MAG: hypothetical protein IJV43_07110 [Oscillospiraceae bacterium]|nr:hypothetical protein [Oscillospiraceae bacterium]
MADYKKMYHELLIGSEQAIAAIDEGRPDTARQRLIIAEHRAEETYAATDDNGEAEESEEDRFAKIMASFERLTEEERRALRWVSEHYEILRKITVGEPLTAGEMGALIEATMDYGVYPLFFIHTRKTELDETIALAAAQERVARRAAERQKQ